MVRIKVILQLTVSRPVCPCIRQAFGTRDQFVFHYMEIIFRQFGVFCHGAVSPTRGRVCNLQLLLGLPSAVFLRSESCEIHNHILFSQFYTPPNQRAKFLYLFPPKTGWSSYSPGHWARFYRLLGHVGLRRMYCTPLPHGRISTDNWTSLCL
jgi:hypothetical protein